MNNFNSDPKTLASEVERIIAAFRDVLAVEHVDPKDNFFELGGDSFAAIRVMSRLGGNVGMVALFEHPTAEALASYVVSEPTMRGARLVPLFGKSTADGSTALVTVPYGGGDLTAYRDLFGGCAGNVHVFGVDFGELDVENAADFSLLVNRLMTNVEEIEASQLVLYGHCAGAATAACMASAAAATNPSVALVVGASQPMTDPDAAIREAERTSDHAWSQYLRSLGAFTGLTDAEADAMSARGRRDHLIAAEAYRALAYHPARGVPALVLFGDEDPATPQPDDIVEEWGGFIDVVESASLTGGGHYFLRTHGREVASRVLSFATRARNGGVQG